MIPESKPVRLLLLSDIHYAGPAERARTHFLTGGVNSAWLRLLIQSYRRYIWLDDPTGKNHLLDRFFERCGDADWVVANGDFSCDSGFVGVSDPAALESSMLCLGRLRERFGSRMLPVMGDHEFGKKSLGGGLGGLRIESLEAARSTLGIPVGWRHTLGIYTLVGVTSSLLALPVLKPETLVEHHEAWERERQLHLDWIRSTFQSVDPNHRILLFCHDPTALPFLWECEEVRARVGQIEQTWIGHLHSRLVFWKSRLLAGMPVMGKAGGTLCRLSSALNRGRIWPQFKVRLCPSLSGIQLLKDGGFWELNIEPSGRRLVETRFHPIPWT